MLERQSDATQVWFLVRRVSTAAQRIQLPRSFIHRLPHQPIDSNLKTTYHLGTHCQPLTHDYPVAGTANSFSETRLQETSELQAQLYATQSTKARMNSLYSLALRQTSSIQAELTELEKSITSSAQNNTAGLHGQITASLSSLQRTLDDYQAMSKAEVVESKRAKASARIEKFKDDLMTLKRQFDQIKKLERTLVSLNRISNMAFLFGLQPFFLHYV